MVAQGGRSRATRPSPLTALAPALVLAAVVVATLLVPIVGRRPPLAGWGDLLVVVGLLALGRFVLALAALDAGSAFGGMGSSREVAIAALVEPALLLALAGAALAAGSTDLGTIAGAGASGRASAWFTPALLLGAAAFAIVAVAETGHEPFDNPDTHLELTMIHEGMLLEASGPRLAILMYAAELKLVLVAGLFAAVFLPFGAAGDLTPLAVARRRSSPPLVKLVVGRGRRSALLDATPRQAADPRPAGPARRRRRSLALIGLAARLWLPA